MKVLFAILAVVAVIATMSLGSGYALAKSAGNTMTLQKVAAVGCQTQFSEMDPGNTGYLSYQQYKEGFFGPGSHTGIGPSGNAQGSFATADRNGDGFLSLQEFCDWKNRP